MLTPIPALIGKDPTEQTALDNFMVQELDGTKNEWGWCKQKLGANAILAVGIGCEIIVNPSLLFLDEPTSGLASTTALRTVQVLHNIAEAGKTVVTTIHQPSSRLFHKFDKLVLLGKGSLLYFGKASESMAYFESIGCSPLIAMNPAEFLLDIANGNLTDISIPPELEDRVHSENLTSDIKTRKPSANDVHEYLVVAYESRVTDKAKKEGAVGGIGELGENVITRREWGANWWEQYSILFLKERRHDYLSWMRITQVIATALILGLLWWCSDVTTPKGLQDQAGLLFFIAVFWGFFPVFTAIFTFPQERAMLNKERAVDMYKLSASWPGLPVICPLTSSCLLYSCSSSTSWLV